MTDPPGNGPARSAARLGREAAFHDQRFTDDSARAPASRFYTVAEPSKEAYRRAVMAACRAGINALELGCGKGGLAEQLQTAGAIHAIDLSRSGVRAAARDAVVQPAAAGVHRCVMDAERLGYAPASFDLVFGSGILHHLDLAAALPELCRVLRPTGQAVFFEPLGHNPLINLYRQRTPGMRTVDEHPLRRRDLERLRAAFRHVHVEFHHLTALGAMALQGTCLFAPVRRLLWGVDRLLLSLPGLRWQAWVVVIQAGQPHAVASGAGRTARC